MTLSAAALDLENRSLGANGAPTLGRAYELLRDQWRSGDRDREIGLHLLFLTWYLLLEPPFQTGLDVTNVQEKELSNLFREVHGAILAGGTDATDAEALYVVGLMAHLTPWLLGDNDEWTARSQQYRSRYRQLSPKGLDPKVFEGRGAYGEYFQIHAALKDAY